MLNLLKRLEEKVAFASKQTFDIAMPSGPQQVQGAVAGVWGVHKPVRGSGWNITHIPTGYAIGHPKSQKEAKAIIDAMVEREPELLNAPDKAAILKHRDLIVKLMKNPPGSKKPMKLDYDEIARILSDEGLGPLGTRYGKAGEMWGIKGNARMIAVGRRDIMRNVYLAEVDDEYSYRKPGTRWVNDEIEYQSKMKEDRLRAWARWAKKGMTTKEVLKKVREQYDKMEPDERGRKYAHMTGRSKNESLGVVLGRLETLTEARQKMLTAKELKKLPPIGATQNESDPKVWVKFFNPYGRGTWFATEYDPKDELFFGYVMGLGGDELGYFSLRELKSIRAEREQYWKPMKLSAAKAYERKLHGGS